MIRINTITDQAGGRPRRKRVGRGESSGMGRTCGRGNKGAQSRTGYRVKRLYEGGQKALYSRFAKVGFNNFNFRTEYQPVNINDLERSFNPGDRVDVEALATLRLIQGESPIVKVLATGDLKKKLIVVAHAFSEKAKAAIEKAGGTAQLIPTRDSAALAKAKRKSTKGKKRPTGMSRIEKKKSRRAGV